MIINGLLSDSNLKGFISKGEEAGNVHSTNQVKVLKENGGVEETKISGTQGEEINKAIEHMQNALENISRKIHLEIETEIDMVIVKVLDAESGEVIRQIPPQELIDIYKKIKDVQGVIFDKEV